MDIFEEAEMELGMDPGELRSTFTNDIVDMLECGHENLIPHRNWASGKWTWSCSDCYIMLPNQWVTDRMRERENNRKEDYPLW